MNLLCLPRPALLALLASLALPSVRSPMRILVAMSGGVDSSVAAHLLAREGHELIGVMMRLWSDPLAPATACGVDTPETAVDTWARTRPSTAISAASTISSAPADTSASLNTRRTASPLVPRTRNVESCRPYRKSRSANAVTPIDDVAAILCDPREDPRASRAFALTESRGVLTNVRRPTKFVVAPRVPNRHNAGHHQKRVRRYEYTVWSRRAGPARTRVSRRRTPQKRSMNTGRWPRFDGRLVRRGTAVAICRSVAVAAPSA